MRISHRPLIFRALVVLKEAARACHDQPMTPNAGVRLALAYLYAIGGDRSNLEGFTEALCDLGYTGAPDWLPKYIRNRDANSAIQGVVRSLGFNATATAHRALDDAVNGDWQGASRRFWAEVDQQVRTGMCRPLMPYEWLSPRPTAAAAASGQPETGLETPARAPS